jgi:glycosyltransferase involved in cell wall biosynthesis
VIQKLSIIIPVFNEEGTINKLLEKVISVNLIHSIQKEIIIIDDASVDKGNEIIKRFIKENPQVDIQIHVHEVNQGKGAAIRSGVKYATGDYIIMQDADLELDPGEFNLLLKPVLENNADVVFGSRFLNKKNKGGRFLARIANGFLTTLTNLVLGIKITDMETCYKLIPASYMKSITLKEERFGFEPEITAKIFKIKGLRFMEVPISYFPRTQELGKKIRWTDGLRAIYCIVKYGWFGK